MLGHKDHGKSTLIGRMLVASGKVTPDRIDEAKRASSEAGVEFEPAFLLDTFSDERELGMTFDNTRVQISHEDTLFELIDVPGHEELMKSMLSGSSSADIGVVVVSAKSDEGITDQTRRHVYVAKMFGVSRFVVAVNKMDLSGFNEETFKPLKAEIGDFLGNIGLRKQDFEIIPISARGDVNIIRRDASVKWYSGRSLFESLVALAHESGNPHSLPPDPRLIIQSVIPRNGATAILGRVIGGEIKPGMKMTVFPGSQDIDVTEILKGMKKAESAHKGESVALVTAESFGGDVRGSVLSVRSFTGKVSNSIRAHIFFVEPLHGELSLLLMDVPVRVLKVTVDEVIDPSSGRRRKGGEVKPLETAIVRITLGKEIAFDTFARCRELGGIVLAHNSRLVGSGIVI